VRDVPDRLACWALAAPAGGLAGRIPDGVHPGLLRWGATAIGWAGAAGGTRVTRGGVAVRLRGEFGDGQQQVIQAVPAGPAGRRQVPGHRMAGRGHVPVDH
jgi:hypothetical protein